MALPALDSPSAPWQTVPNFVYYFSSIRAYGMLSLQRFWLGWTPLAQGTDTNIDEERWWLAGMGVNDVLFQLMIAHWTRHSTTKILYSTLLLVFGSPTLALLWTCPSNGCYRSTLPRNGYATDTINDSIGPQVPKRNHQRIIKIQWWRPTVPIPTKAWMFPFPPLHRYSLSLYRIHSAGDLYGTTSLWILTMDVGSPIETNVFVPIGKFFDKLLQQLDSHAFLD